jgi:Uma2 family endonuclease
VVGRLAGSSRGGRCPERSTIGEVAAPQKPRPSLEELWARLQALPVNVKGEILDGELYVHPRREPRPARAIGFLGRHLGGAFDYDEVGPGGWWIVPEPGIELPNSPEVSPDLAGSRRSRMPDLPPDGEPFRSAPDWVYEVLSPSNARYDRAIKQPFYARMGVSWLWLVDPRDQTLQVSELVDAH